MSFQRKLTNFTNIAPGAVATLRIPVGPTYDRILLRLCGSATAANFNLANIQNVRLLANAKVIREYADLTVLNALNQFHGLGAAANAGAAGAAGTDTSICFFFRKPYIQQFTYPARPAIATSPAMPPRRLYGVEAERVTSFRTANLNTLTLEMLIAAAVVNPLVEAYSDEQPDVSEPVGLIEKVRRFTYAPSAAGDFETLYDIPRGPRIMAIHYNSAGVIINKLTIKANSVALFDTVSTNAGPLGVGGAINSAGALQDFSRFTTQNTESPQPGFNSVSFVQNGNLDEAFRTANLRDLRGTITLAGAVSLPVYVEYLDTFDGL